MKLTNDTLTIEIAAHGAEMTSLRKGETEYLWNGDPAYWKRQAPVLFPIVGKVFDNHCSIDGQRYELSQHGFARDMDFSLLSHSRTEALFSLRWNESTLRMYPYRFELRVAYRLRESRVQVEWQVENLDGRTMYYQIGGHPAFLLRDYMASDKVHGYLLFECMADEEDYDLLDHLRVNRLAPSGCCLNQYNDIPLQEGLLPLTDDTFAHDALVLEDSQTECVTLLDKEKQPYLRLTSIDATVMGLWSPHITGCPFTCIEPWMGRADREGFDLDITRKEHIHACLVGECETFAYEIELL